MKEKEKKKKLDLFQTLNTSLAIILFEIIEFDCSLRLQYEP